MRWIILLFFVVFLNAKTMIANYYAKYGLFGTIAKANVIYSDTPVSYKITSQARAVGFAATLSKHMVQTYSSTGIIQNGILIPHEYVSERKKGHDIYKNIYVFDHNAKTITKYKYKNGKLTDKYKLKYYTKDDILSLYFNLPKYVRDFDTKVYTFYALGGRKGDGRIDITFLKGKELEKMKDRFDNTPGLYIKANLYNKIFAGDKGILYLVIDPKTWVTKAGMVKNVLKIGDLKGRIESLSLTP